MTESFSDIDSADARIVFMGTPEFAVPSLRALADSGLTPIAVVTGADKKRGRGQMLTATPIKNAALELGVETILQPESVRATDFVSDVKRLQADIIVVVAFRILPEEVFSASRLGTFNLHGSLLPRYRGAAPINRAIMQGDTETGVTTFFLQQKVDTGNVIMRRSMPIGENETAGEVHDRMMHLGAQVVVETTRQIMEGRATPQAQDDAEASGAPKIFRQDCLLDFSQSNERVHNQTRGLSPYPGAITFMEGKQVKIFRTHLAEGRGEPGEILSSEDTLRVACGEQAVEILELQMEGKRRMSSIEFLRGTPLRVGQKFSVN